MPTALLAGLLAVALAGVVALLTPTILRRLPVPEEAEDLPPFIELDSLRFRWTVFATAAVAGGVALDCTAPSLWPAWAPFAALGALLGLIDLRTTYLPLRLSYLALALVCVGVAVTALLQGSVAPVLWGAAGGAGAAALFWLAWRLSGGRMGFGDVRLAGLIGVVAGTGGLTLVLWSFLLGTTAGAIWGLATRVRRGVDGEFPYGPALLLGPILALVVQQLFGR
ncbi:MAG: A24 family peptidase [Propionicimonas sp.]|uniref:prepilin peptidase n=1 Tax=Propionicimonas sp. TaxID=1955623 RepID=UPI003D13316B